MHITKPHKLWNCYFDELVCYTFGTCVVNCGMEVWQFKCLSNSIQNSLVLFRDLTNLLFSFISQAKHSSTKIGTICQGPSEKHFLSYLAKYASFHALKRSAGHLWALANSSNFFPPVPRNLASPAKRAYKQFKKFPLLYLEMSRWNHFSFCNTST